MNKRQKKKFTKKWLIESGFSTDGNAYCVYCNEKIDFNDKWQMRYGACNQLCYGKAVGVY